MTQIPTHKTCNRCGINKPITDFYRFRELDQLGGKSYTNYRNQCKRCTVGRAPHQKTHIDLIGQIITIPPASLLDYEPDYEPDLDYQIRNMK